MGLYMKFMSIFKIFEFATSVSFILKRIRDNETKTDTLIGIVTDLTNEVRYTVNSRNTSSGISSDFTNTVLNSHLNGINMDNLPSLVINEQYSNDDELDELDELDEDEDEHEDEDED